MNVCLPTRKRRIALGALSYSRPLVMGVLNVTPDSFSDGGAFASVDKAVARALTMIADGADIIDIGAESTRPGARPVALAEELQRVIPVLERIRGESEITISIDTTKSVVARDALNSGADMINDISAGLFDREMVPLVAQKQAGYIVMHMRGTPQTMQKSPEYEDVVKEVRDFLKERCESCVAAGIKAESLLIDPGIGFGKTAAHNLALLTNLSALTALGAPVVIGASRKSFIDSLTENNTSAQDRLGGSLAAALFAVERGASVVRVHDVRETSQALEVMRELQKAVPAGKEARR